MDQIYRFSPIKDEKSLLQVFEYLAIQLNNLSNKLFNLTLPVTSLKVFSHYPEEYNFLRKIISSMGSEVPFNSPTSFYVKVDQKFVDHDIGYLGIRVVDPYRLQVGCGDYEILDFENFKKHHLLRSEFVRPFSNDSNILEIWHPDFDILGYAIPSQKQS